MPAERTETLKKRSGLIKTLKKKADGAKQNFVVNKLEQGIYLK